MYVAGVMIVWLFFLVVCGLQQCTRELSCPYFCLLFTFMQRVSSSRLVVLSCVDRPALRCAALILPRRPSESEHCAHTVHKHLDCIHGPAVCLCLGLCQGLSLCLC